MSWSGVSYLASVLAAVGSLLFGAGARGGASATPYVIAFIALLIMALFLAGLLGHLGAGQVKAWNGIVAGAAVWGGFVVTSLVVNHTFQNAKKMLTVIDAGHWLGVLLIQGAVIGWMGVG
jgi:hypothetical protein